MDNRIKKFIKDVDEYFRVEDKGVNTSSYMAMKRHRDLRNSIIEEAKELMKK